MGAFQILSVACGALGIASTIHLAKVKQFNEAASVFRSDFNDEFLALNPATHSNAVDAREMLEAAFHKHSTAIIEFKQVLSSFEAEGLEQAWQEYYRFDNAPEVTVRGLTKYSGFGYSYGEKQCRRQLAKDRIGKLLFYAKHRRFL